MINDHCVGITFTSFAINQSINQSQYSYILPTCSLIVERRQAKVMQSAVHSNAIVSSLFPATVRERLFKTDTSTKNGTSSEPTQGLEHNKTRLKTFLSSDGSRSGSPFQSSLDTILDRQPPIADLFPECTVSFCDIRGFTAWSSVREPSQVFQLLETLYSVFDLIAMRRGVFKVETIGDAYVAVTGLPEPRADHAIVATKFARDCLVRSAEVVQGLEKSLGPGTGELRLRFGVSVSINFMRLCFVLEHNLTTVVCFALLCVFSFTADP
jgi:hypothetical protein